MDPLLPPHSALLTTPPPPRPPAGYRLAPEELERLLDQLDTANTGKVAKSQLAASQVRRSLTLNNPDGNQCRGCAGPLEAKAMCSRCDGAASDAL